MSDQPSNDVIFEEALGKSTPEQRNAYLDEVCRGDEPLRQLMARMVEDHLRVGQFLETPVDFFDHLDEMASDSKLSIDPHPSSESLEAMLPGLLGPTERAESMGRIGGLEVLEVVARGGMGIVLRGFDEKLNREIAIKLLPPEVAANADARRRFVREARRAASVVHDNVIAIHAVDDAGVLPYIVMPYIEGRSLQQKIGLEGPLPMEDILKIGIQITEGLAAIHARGLVHRDLKPANCLIENHGERVRITDFGVARAFDDPHVTQQGMIAGTPAYMSPEQAGGQPVDHRSDLFSLGSVLYAMCTGRPPFEGDSVVGVIRQVFDEKPKPVRERNPAVPVALSELVSKLHARDPANRPQSTSEVAAELKSYLVRLESSAEPDTTHDRSSVRRQSPMFGQRARIAAVASLFVLIALGATEATGVTNVGGTVIRLLMPQGTLVIEVNDPAVRVALEGTDIVISGAGVQEIRLKPGAYQLSASRDGKLLRQELITVNREGRQVVRIDREATPEPNDAAAWEKRVAGLSPEAQVAAVVERLKQLNPGYDGNAKSGISNGFINSFDIVSDSISDLSPVRAFPRLISLGCLGTSPGKGRVKDLRPLQGMPLEYLMLSNQAVLDLEPVRGMPLKVLILSNCPVEDLSPLRDATIRSLQVQNTRIKSLEPLRGTSLTSIDLHGTIGVRNLSPLEGMPLNYLNVSFLPIEPDSWRVISGLRTLKMLVLANSPLKDIAFLSPLSLDQLSLHGIDLKDIRPVAKMPLERITLEYRPEFAGILRSISTLKKINGKPVDDFFREVEAGSGK